MFIHPHDRVDDEITWRAFLAAQGFGQLIANGVDGADPVAVPTQFVLDGDEILVHVIARNPILNAVAAHGRAMLSVAGDWAFVPGAWKAVGDEDPREGIPTTYYAAVQIRGRCTVVSEPAAVAELLRVQVAALDPTGSYIDPLDHGAKVRSIRGLRLRIEDVDAKFKFGGNVDRVHRAAVRDHLLARDRPGDRSAAGHIRLDG